MLHSFLGESRTYCHFLRRFALVARRTGHTTHSQHTAHWREAKYLRKASKIKGRSEKGVRMVT